MGAVMRVRHRLAFSIHKFFNDRGFVSLQTPIITASDCEGAGEMFQVTTLDLNAFARCDVLGRRGRRRAYGAPAGTW